MRILDIFKRDVDSISAHNECKKHSSVIILLITIHGAAGQEEIKSIQI